MKITKEQIKDLKPRGDARQWYLSTDTHKEEDLEALLLRTNAQNSKWARWLFARIMSVKQRREIAIFAAEQVLHIFEEKYPKDNRPRKAIEAARMVLEVGSGKNRLAAYSAAAAAYSAADAASAATAAAAYAAAYAASAADAAYSAADAAYSAHVSAAFAAASADSAATASEKTREMQERIIKEAVRILDRDATTEEQGGVGNG